MIDITITIGTEERTYRVARTNAPTMDDIPQAIPVGDVEDGPHSSRYVAIPVELIADVVRAAARLRYFYLNPAPGEIDIATTEERIYDHIYHTEGLVGDEPVPYPDDRSRVDLDVS